MDNGFKCGVICLGIGMLIGGIIVAKNKKLANKIDDGTEKIADTFQEIKSNIEDKIENAKKKNSAKSKAD